MGSSRSIIAFVAPSGLYIKHFNKSKAEHFCQNRDMLVASATLSLRTAVEAHRLIRCSNILIYLN